MESVRHIGERGLSWARRRMGRRMINWTPEFMGFGNQLYLWAWAHAGRDQPLERRVLMTEKMRYWAAQVPDFAESFLVERGDVRLLDQRDHLWAKPIEHSGDRRGFTARSRREFLTDCLLPSPLLAGVGEGPLASDDVLTMNVRRGDYYSVTEHREQFGIDLAAYLTAAVARSIDRDGPVRRIHVVSDDIAWCRDLDWLPRFAPEVTFAAPEESPAQNFRDVCCSRRLVISNSTFSMWGAFVSNLVHSDNSSHVWAPAFFQRSYGPGRCFEYDADWSFVDDLPGGWQPSWVLEGRAG